MTRRILLATVALLCALNGGCSMFQTDDKAARAKSPMVNEDWEKEWKAPK